MKPPLLCLAIFVATPCALGNSNLEPLVGFVANAGQWDDRMRFCARDHGIVVAVTHSGFDVRRAHADGVTEVVGFEFVGERSLTARGEQPFATAHHFYLGNDPSSWVRDVPGYARAVLDGIGPGAKAVLRLEEDGFHYDVVTTAGCDPATIRVRCHGARIEKIDADGSLMLRTARGWMRHTAPKAWLAATPDQPVACGFRIVSDTEFTFATDCTSASLVIDPGIEWSTYFGGNTQVMPLPFSVFGTYTSEMKVLADGSTLLTGSSGHVDFPTTPGVIQPSLAGEPRDAFISRLSADGSSLLFSTFLGGKKYPFPIGGGGNEDSVGVFVASDGAIVIGGFTTSADFPTTPGVFTTPAANHVRAFACRLTPDGSTLLASSLFAIGTNGNVLAFAADESDGIALAGQSFGPGLSTSPGAFDASYNGASDGFVAVLSGDFKTLKMATYLGTSTTDAATAVAIRGGAVVVAGHTASVSFPITQGVVDGAHSGPNESFVTRFDIASGGMQSSTFLGGSASEATAAVHIDGYGNTVVAGNTLSLDFPTTPGAFMSVPWQLPAGDGYIACLDPTGSSLAFSTYFGGVASDRILDLDVDDDGFVTVFGDSHSSQAGFPTTPGALQEDWTNRFAHLFVSRLLRDGRTLVYSTGFGGSGGNIASTLDCDATGSTTFAAGANEIDYPITPGAFDSTQNANGNKSGVTRIDMLPTGVSRIGTSSAGCAGPLAAGVISSPKAAGKSFEVTCTHGPPNSYGFLIVSAMKLAPPIVASGATLFVDPAVSQLALVTTDDLGFVRQAIPLRHSLLGAKGYVQFVFPDACASGGWSASTALEVVVQP